MRSSALRELFAAVSDAFSTVFETFSSCLSCAVVVVSFVAVVGTVLSGGSGGLYTGGVPVGSRDVHISSESAASGTFVNDDVGHDHNCASIWRSVWCGVVFRSSIDVILGLPL